VMWSVVEKTALAEAEVEYQDYQSDMIWVKFPIVRASSSSQLPSADALALLDASVVIWTTTPWTIPGNRAISYSSNIEYGLYEVTAAAAGNWARVGEKYVLADTLAADVMKSAKVDQYRRLAAVNSDNFFMMFCEHPLENMGYDFHVPLLDGSHVTDDTGTGFVHTAPGHGTDDYKVWMSAELTKAQKKVPQSNAAIHIVGSSYTDDEFQKGVTVGLENRKLSSRTRRIREIEKQIPTMVDADGVLTKAAPGFEGKRVLKENGDKGDANDAVIKALSEAGNIIARGRLKHQYPHSWRSKKPVIFRNTPQWFIGLDVAPGDSPAGSRPEGASGGQQQALSQVAAPHPSPLPARGERGSTLRSLAEAEIERVQWVPEAGRNRINGMVATRPDWVVSRQRAWGVPITVFRHTQTDEIIPNATWAHSAELVSRIEAAFDEKGADVWFEPGAKERFLGGLVPAGELAAWEQVRDVLDVWFDSGSTHAFTLEDPVAFPGLKGISRKSLVKGGQDRVMYLEGSDQHRGWFQSSLLESCGTRGSAPYDIVLTHGFILDEKGDEKMSKSKGNVLSPQDVMKTTGADILRLWVASADTTNDIRFGPSILQASADSYRKLRNTLRWMLGALAHFNVAASDTLVIAASDSAGAEPAGRGTFNAASDSPAGEPAGRGVSHRDMPELERLMLHRLAELDREIRQAYETYDFRKVVALLSHFMNTELSAFYFDIRKDTLYCEAPSSLKRQAALTVVDHLCEAILKWLAPILSFTADEAFALYRPGEAASIHLTSFPKIPREWRDDNLAAKWDRVREVRSAVTAALELERAGKRIGSSLEAAPIVYVDDADLMSGLDGVDLAEVCITSGIEVIAGALPESAVVASDVKSVGVIPKRAEGKKCARSWRITTDVGSDPAYPDLSARDAAAMREIDSL